MIWEHRDLISVLRQVGHWTMTPWPSNRRYDVLFIVDHRGLLFYKSIRFEREELVAPIRMMRWLCQWREWRPDHVVLASVAINLSMVASPSLLVASPRSVVPLSSSPTSPTINDVSEDSIRIYSNMTMVVVMITCMMFVPWLLSTLCTTRRTINGFLKTYGTFDTRASIIAF